MVEYPKPWLLFWAAAIIGLIYMNYSFVLKFRGWNRGAKTSPHSATGRVVKIWLAEVLLQRQLLTLSPFRWFVHMLVFYGFAGLLSLSILASILKLPGYLRIDGGMAHFFLSGKGYPLIKVWGDVWGAALLAGLLLALVRRLFFRPAQQNNKQMDLFLLLLLLWLTVSGFALEVTRVALAPGEIARYSFFAHMFVPSGVYKAELLRPWLTALWTLHAFSVAGLLFYVPHSKLMHSLLAPVVIGMNAAEEQHREDIYWPDIRRHSPTRSPGD